jgi:hypothetical protein
LFHGLWCFASDAHCVLLSFWGMKTAGQISALKPNPYNRIFVLDMCLLFSALNMHFSQPVNRF